MSCVLNIAGRNFDPDLFIRETGLKNFLKRYKEEPEGATAQAAKQYSSVSAIISEADLTDFERQKDDARQYLVENQKGLGLISRTAEIEFATVNFMVELKSVSDQYFAQYIYLPAELTSICGSLKIGIEVAIVR